MTGCTRLGAVHAGLCPCPHALLHLGNAVRPSGVGHVGATAHMSTVSSP